MLKQVSFGSNLPGAEGFLMELFSGVLPAACFRHPVEL
jgi:hypothetical protein